MQYEGAEYNLKIDLKHFRYLGVKNKNMNMHVPG